MLCQIWEICSPVGVQSGSMAFSSEVILLLRGWDILFFPWVLALWFTSAAVWGCTYLVPFRWGLLEPPPRPFSGTLTSCAPAPCSLTWSPTSVQACFAKRYPVEVRGVKFGSGLETSDALFWFSRCSSVCLLLLFSFICSSSNQHSFRLILLFIHNSWFLTLVSSILSLIIDAKFLGKLKCPQLVSTGEWGDPYSDWLLRTPLLNVTVFPGWAEKDSFWLPPSGCWGYFRASHWLLFKNVCFTDVAIFSFSVLHFEFKILLKLLMAPVNSVGGFWWFVFHPICFCLSSWKAAACVFFMLKSSTTSCFSCW